MQVRGVMTTTVVTVPPEASLESAARAMVQHAVAALPVVADGSVLGVVSERDVLRSVRAAPGLAGQVTGAMSAPVISVPPTAELAEAASALRDQRIRCLPVIEPPGVDHDPAPRLVGIVTRTDLLRAFRRTDDELAREVRAAVAAVASSTAVTGMQVDARDGVVWLRGRVDLRSHVSEVLAAARRVDGVIAVRSEVEHGFDDLQGWRPEGPRPVR